MAKKELGYEAALGRAAGLCSRAEHSRAEIQRKLRQWGAASEVASQVVGWLEANGFIDEERFARAFVHDKSRFDCWGRVKIRYALRQHGISSAVADAAMSEIDKEEYGRNLQMILESKFRSAAEKDPYKLKNALFRYALSRGFEPELVLPVVSDLVSGAEDFDVSGQDCGIL